MLKVKCLIFSKHTKQREREERERRREEDFREAKFSGEDFCSG